VGDQGVVLDQDLPEWTTPASLEGETSGKDVTRGIWEEAPAGAAGTSGADGV
jgi:hypothetical protein